MKPLSSSRRLFIRNFVVRLSSRLHLSTSTATSNPSSGFLHHHQSRRHEEESRNVRVFVWWDFENCAPPVGSNVYRVSQSITAAIRSNGIKGPVQITAFGDVLQLSRNNQVALSATGIVLTHVPQGGKNSADRSLLMDLMHWVSQNPPPAHIFLISSDRDFASTLHRLRMNNYNILLASRDAVSGVLCSAASIMWDWNALVKGENLTGKHFNQPPDGPYGSWYGHYRVPIQDPFAVSSEQPPHLQSDEAKPRSVPKAVVNAIRSILKSNPQGIPITELRAELGKSNLMIEKDLYGYKKFSRLLLSMPHILTIESEGNGYYSVHGIAPKVSEIGDSSSPPICSSPVTTISENLDSTLSSKRNMCCKGASPATNTENLVSTVSSVAQIGGKINGRGDMSSKGAGNENSSSHSSSKPNTKMSLQVPPKEVTESQSHVLCSSPLVEKENNVEVIASKLHSAEEGFLKWIWSKWLRGKEDFDIEKHFTSGDKNEKIKQEVQFVKSIGTSPDPAALSPSGDKNEKIKQEVQFVKSIGTSPDPAALSPSSSSTENAAMTSSSNEIIVDENINRSSVVIDDKPSKRPGIFSRIMSWCKFQKSEQDAGSLCEEVDGRKGKKSVDLNMQELFSESVWNDMLAFLRTPIGSESILQSKTRKEMVENLQKQGPCSVSSLTEAHVFQLVDLLISDKKWVEEESSTTQAAAAFPFRLVLPPAPPGTRRNKSRGEVLGDCEKLLNETLKENPDGFYMGSFRKLFLNRYGYYLDVQKLGYQKLISLLQIMPGVKIESERVVFLNKTDHPPNNISQSSSLSLKSDTRTRTEWSKKDDKDEDDDDDESPWEELGPVANSTAGKRSSSSSRVGKEEEECATQKQKKKKLHNYESVSHNHESSSSDSEEEEEEEMLLSEEEEGQRKVRRRKNNKEEDSSLLEILDSWYSSSKEEDNNNKRTRRRVAASASALASDGGMMVEESVLKPSEVVNNFGRKQRSPMKTYYSFVAADEPTPSGAGDNKKGKLINGIIGSLNKSGVDVLSQSSRI